MSTFMYNDETFPMPVGDQWKRTPNEVYDDVEQIDTDSWADSDDAVRLKFLRQHGFESVEQFDAYRSYINSKVDFVAHAQTKMEEMVKEQQQKMRDTAAALQGTEMMEPISGITLQAYAQINAQLAQGRNQGEVLQQNGIELVSWDKATAGWNERMRIDTSFTVTSEYSRFFMEAGQGQFGAEAKEVAEGMTGKKLTGDNPLTLEQYAEIMAAQGAAAAQGKDVNQVLASYGLNAADWGTLGLHWTNKMMTDMNVGMKFGELYARYNDQFAAQTSKVADDINF